MTGTVLITGSSNGIGRETAKKFAKEGFNIIINCRKDVESLDSLKRELTGYGVSVLSCVKDVGQFEQIKEMFEDSEKNNMIPDIVINNAGVSYVGLLQDMTPDDWNNIIQTNLTSLFNTSHAAIPYMLKKGSGRIINISSMWGNTGASCEVAYSASKGGVNLFTKALAKELAPSHISVNAVAFGAVDTRMNGFLSTEEKQMLIDEIPAGRFLSPAEAADIIYDIAMLNEYVTGQIITADGGMT